MIVGSSIVAMIFSLPPQCAQCSMSDSNTRFRSRAQDIFAALEGAHGLVEESDACSHATLACAGKGCGTIAARGLACGASPPWKRIKCRQGRGTSAAHRCMNSSGDITMCEVPSL